MKRLNILTWLVIMVMMVVVAGCGGQQAKAPEAPKFPAKQIDIICPFAAGGGTDLVARALANSTKDKLGQPVMVVNKTGGVGAVGMNDGAKAKPDGYTVTMITVELVTLTHLGLAQLNYQDFEPILRVNMDPSAITVRTDAPWKNMKEFLDYAKQHPGQVKVGNAGPGSIWHLAAAALEQKTGVQFNHVPYSGGAAPAVVALLGGNIDAVAVSPAEVDAQVKAGKLRVLGVASETRAKALPDVPTMKEQGIDLVLGTWRGLAVPKGTPAPVVKILHDAFKKGMEDKAFVDYMDKAGLGLGYLSGEAFKASMKAEEASFGTLIEKLGLKKK